MRESRGTILVVGHCTPDAYAIRSALNRHFPGIDVQFIEDQDTLDQQLRTARLLLVNRVLEGEFASDDGIALVRSLTEQGPGGPRLMLVSGLTEAQAAAVAAGALPGFGKRDLHSDQTRERIAGALV